jgi:alpha-L-arabinofuranosidase
VLPVTVDDGAGEASPAGGAVGVGTWLTSAEFRDLKVTSGGTTLYAGDLASGMGAFRQQGDGQWSVEDGVLRQTKSSENVRAYIGDKSWGNYTYSLKARKLDGSEGFLIPFAVTDENAKCWWNLGGFSNSRHCVEIGGSSVAEAGGSIETGRWYDIRIELQGRSVRCFLDGKLIHDFKLPETRPLYASATCDNASGELILKVINTGAVALDVDIALDGAKTRAKSARVTQLSSADPTDENSLDEPKKVAPVTKVVALGDTPFRQTFPGNSVTVLRVK